MTFCNTLFRLHLYAKHIFSFLNYSSVNVSRHRIKQPCRAYVRVIFRWMLTEPESYILHIAPVLTDWLNPNFDPTHLSDSPSYNTLMSRAATPGSSPHHVPILFPGANSKFSGPVGFLRRKWPLPIIPSGFKWAYSFIWKQIGPAVLKKLIMLKEFPHGQIGVIKTSYLSLRLRWAIFFWICYRRVFL